MGIEGEMSEHDYHPTGFIAIHRRPTEVNADHQDMTIESLRTECEYVTGKR